MRHLLFAILVALPTALITWLVSRGTGPCRVAAAQAASLGTAALPVSDAPQGAEPVTALDPDAKLRALLALPLPGFKLSGEPSVYDDKSLFEYINGAAPLFIDRHFRQLLASEIKVAQGGEATCDIYDMRRTENAAAIYAKERPPSAVATALGDEAHTGRMALVFRRGQYYVKLTAFDAQAEAKLTALAQILVGRMP